ncbi:MAG: ATP-grasp domain-containing protein [Candidatus Gracilibacteria bacterium]|nr:ATP-grasp domain-containing protein [Candidatus Gracilibacteria bacterium]
MNKIALLSGGTSSEREVALKSSELFKEFLNKNYDFYDLPKDMDLFLENKDKYDFAIPVFHGIFGEDGMIFAFLNSLGINTCFSPFQTHSICLDKFKSNILAENIGLKIPKQFIYEGKLEIDNFPLIIKPNTGGSSLYTYKVDSLEDFNDKIKFIQKNINDDILVQEFIIGDEYSVSVVAGEVLPIMKVEKKEKEDFFDFDSKYNSLEKMQETWPKLDKNLNINLNNLSLKIYNFFKCRGFSRVDFLVNENGIYFLEVNTIPGMTKSSILPKSWLLTGRTFDELIFKIIND